MGLTQFLPSDFYKYAVDFDGDGRRDIWHSVPDALASAAKQLVDKGWQRGVRWSYEVRAPANVDCTIGVPEITRPIGEWLKPVSCRLMAARSRQPNTPSPHHCCSRPVFMARPSLPQRTIS